MGSGSEDEDDETSNVPHQHPVAVGVTHLGVHSMGLGGTGEQVVVGSQGDLPLGNDSCKQEDSEDQGRLEFFAFDTFLVTDILITRFVFFPYITGSITY